MSQFQICNQQHMDYTFIANEFIDGFLADANDAQIKIYLYLLRHSCQTGPNSVSAIADFFNYTEKDVLRALTYWERKKVLHLEYDTKKNLCGVSFVTLTPSNITPTPSPKDLSGGSLQTVPNTPEFNVPVMTKQEYSLDELKAFQSKETTAELLFITESYLGKTLSASDIRSLFFISEELHFSFDLIDYLLQYCVDRGKRDFRYIEKVAISWSQAGISSPDEAQIQATRYDKNTYTVMNALGKSTQPTAKEAEYIKRWYQIYGFTSDVILEACERTVLATDKHRFEYADKILSNWKSCGVHHKTDIVKADASYNNQKKKTITISSKNKFNQFQQNEYDFDALEKELLSN